MKKTILAIIIVVLAVVAIIILGHGPSNNTGTNPDQGSINASTTNPIIPVTEINKVSNKTSKYENAELGFSVNYPSSWEADNTNTGVTFVMPIDQSQVSTIAKLEADISVSASKCAFPPITTVQDRSTITVGANTLNSVSMSNSVQGRGYFNRLYTLQKGSVCYLFAFSSITLAPESKNLTGSNLTQAQNNNKAIVNTADSDFINMVKSFVFVQGPAGKDETQVSPAH